MCSIINLETKNLVRDQEIQRIFEIADDSLQGVLGYHFYVMAINKSADPNKLKVHLPTISGKEAFLHTFSWGRYYQKEDLINTFSPPFFELYQSRISLTAITSIFNDLLATFVAKLKSKGYPQHLDNGRGQGDATKYKPLIKWAFSESQKCTIGDLKAITRLPKTFGIIEEARRLRNLIIHNHGIFDKQYESEAIELKGIEKITHPDYEKFKATGKPVALIINSEDIFNFSRAHIEVLHILHNQIQKEYFYHPDPYDYGKEGKDIGWHYAFWGNATIDDLKEINMKESYLKI